jgi:hemerythrin
MSNHQPVWIPQKTWNGYDHYLVSKLDQGEDVAKFIWREEYCIGHAEIDAQHKDLFGLQSKLYDAVSAGHGKELVEQVVEELLSYVRNHFILEETLMSEMNYPGFEEHRRQHLQLLERVNSMRSLVARGENLASIELLEFMNDWLSQHILKSDLQLTELFQNA